ncbi:MAG: hypothetical protein HQM16_15320 [Deltaproteobacteria bacterium]|nr:hypothetical protein [Deltaproteobacteria bacterium]
MSQNSFFFKTNLFLFFLLALFSLACGKQVTEDTDTEGNLIITIVENSFIPESITAVSGDVIYFFNNDTIEHRIKSQSAANLFDDVGFFDSDIIPQDGVSFITIHLDQTSGSIIYFYDDILKGQMNTPNGQINIE